ncbi:MAG: hypothetical protein CFE21_11695 [Bacteroidetes bacterium B1(2017)]|nr:MAG: hypothetical protein CFE21_11695 [Bacteroidetes bacterium B1(2017)]
MGIKIYEVGTFTKKEKVTFDKISNLLTKEFQNSLEDIILMGAISTQGQCNLDALIFKRNAIIVIEFKNYGGEITTSVNGDWTAGNIIIKGGAGGKNPLQQVNLYKSSLANDLSKFYPDSKSEWFYSAAIVLFQQPIKFVKHGGDNLNWLHIIEEKDFVALVKRVNCTQRISFTQKEFESIPKHFDVEKKIVKIEEDKHRIVLSPLEYIAEDLRNHSKIKKLIEEKTFIGIDFGTSSTIVSYVRFDEDTKSVRTETLNFEYIDVNSGRKLESHILPSVVFYDKFKEKILIGHDARQRRGEAKPNENYWYSFKIQLGQDLGNVFNKSQLNKNNALGSIRNNKEATKVFLNEVIKQTREFVKRNKLPSELFFSVSIPASFEANQRKDLLDVLTSLKIEFNKDLFIDEPNAAFLSYLQTSPAAYDKNFTSQTLVFDFGAGTCDISVLELGFSSEGFFTKNLSISEFKELGGDNIDRKLANEVLFPMICVESGVDIDSVSDPEYEMYFKDILKPFAENFKIGLSNQLRKKPLLENTETIFMGGDQVEVILQSNKRKMVSNSISVSFAEFHETMKSYISAYDGEDKENIFYLVNSALNKAGLQANEIDNVLLVGGSCYNPYIINALKEHFKTSTVIIPSDLQSHVSKGAALHSFFSNGLKKNPLIPIVSETIYVQLADGKLIVLVNAGETIPSKNKNVTRKLTVQNVNQSSIEIPVFVGDDKRLIQNLQVNFKPGFSPNDTFKIKGEIDENKVLIISVELNGKPLVVEQIQPFANEVLTSHQTNAKILLRQINNLISDEGEGASDLAGLVNDLVKLHERVGNFHEAFNLMMRFKPENFGNIAYYASHAGLEKFKSEYIRLAYENDKSSSIAAYNFAHEFDENSQEYEKYMKESFEKGDKSAWFYYGKLLEKKGDSRGAKLVRNAYDFYLKEYNNRKNDLELWEYYRLEKAAKYLNLYKESEEYEKTRKKIFKTKDSVNTISSGNQLVEKIPSFKKVNRN